MIDANVLVYASARLSLECEDFLRRCSREEVFGVCLIQSLNDATHILMLGEAENKGIITDSKRVRQLKENPDAIKGLTEYWAATEKLLRLNLTLVPLDEPVVRRAHPERVDAGLMTNDSMIVASMRHLGIRALAARDADFERVIGIDVFRPGDVL
jgi:predicted nucleic acid-binding protein